MIRHKNWFVVLVMIAVLLLSACGGPAETPPAENNESTQEEATATTATEEEPVIAEEEATATSEPTAAPEPTATPEPTPEATEETLDFSDASTLEEIESINSFRIHVEMNAEGDAFAEDEAELAGLTMDGSFIKEPPAQHIVMSFGEGAESGFGTIEFIQIDDKGYTNFGGQWVEVPAEQSPEIDDLTFISPKELGDEINQLERVGDETINGRETVHLYGDKEILANLSTAEDDLGLDQAEEAQLDLWVDKEEGFIVRMSIVAEGTGLNEENPEASGRMEMTINYTDFNADFQIEAPEVSGP